MIVVVVVVVIVSVALPVELEGFVVARVTIPAVRAVVSVDPKVVVVVVSLPVVAVVVFQVP